MVKGRTSVRVSNKFTTYEAKILINRGYPKTIYHEGVFLASVLNEREDIIFAQHLFSIQETELDQESTSRNFTAK